MAQIYKVGGIIRDKILGLHSDDIDFTFVCENSTTIEEGWLEMVNWMTERNYKIFLETPDCFTIRAKFPKGHTNEGLVADFVMARKEVGYIEGTRRPILELGTLEDDLTRRDFTVNALAEDIDGNIIDLFNGLEDLKKGILRTPINAKKTMMDDPLRILRALRFMITKNMFPASELWVAIQQPHILEKLEKTVSKERMREEIAKMFQFDTVRSFKLLMDVEGIIPGFLDLIFKDGMKLIPTFKKK
jgi:tRNA nucleotidyltransferase/poly(A) polymerase